MKTEKMSFKTIKDVLSRDEMKMIMAGSGEGCGMCMITVGVTGPNEPAGSGIQTMSFGCSYNGGYLCLCNGNQSFC